MNIQVDPTSLTSSNLASAMLNSKIRPRAVVGYGVKIFHPSPPNYVTRSPGCNSFEAREKSRVHGAIGFGFAFHWLKNWRDSFKPITKRSKRNHVITFDSHFKTALFPASCFLLKSSLFFS